MLFTTKPMMQHSYIRMIELHNFFDCQEKSEICRIDRWWYAKHFVYDGDAISSHRTVVDVINSMRTYPIRLNSERTVEHHSNEGLHYSMTPSRNNLIISTTLFSLSSGMFIHWLKANAKIGMVSVAWHSCMYTNGFTMICSSDFWGFFVR